MSEYWVSKKRYFCKYCDIYIADDAPSRQQHENGLRHKGNQERFVRNLYKVGEKRKKDAEEERREMARIEQVRPFSHPTPLSVLYSWNAIGCTSSVLARRWRWSRTPRLFLPLYGPQRRPRAQEASTSRRKVRRLLDPRVARLYRSGPRARACRGRATTYARYRRRVAGHRERKYGTRGKRELQCRCSSHGRRKRREKACG